MQGIVARQQHNTLQAIQETDAEDILICITVAPLIIDVLLVLRKVGNHGRLSPTSFSETPCTSPARKIGCADVKGELFSSFKGGI